MVFLGQAVLELANTMPRQRAPLLIVVTTKTRSEKISATADFIKNLFWRNMMDSAVTLELPIYVLIIRTDDGGCCFLKVIDSSLAGAAPSGYLLLTSSSRCSSPSAVDKKIKSENMILDRFR